VRDYELDFHCNHLLVTGWKLWSCICEGGVSWWDYYWRQQYRVW